MDHAQIGKMFVTSVSFQWHEATAKWEGDKSLPVPAHWAISAKLNNKPNQYGGEAMTFAIEQGIGQRLAEVLMPVVVAQASAKAQQLADDSKAMVEALGDRAIKCITNMPEK